MNKTAMLDSNSTAMDLNSNHASTLLVPDLIINILIVILTTGANLCLIVIELKIWKNRKRISQPKMLILLLAGNDILSSVLGILPQMFVYVQTTHCFCVRNVFIYKFSRFCSVWFFFLSKLMVVLMGIERCIAIRAPFFYIRRCTIKAFIIVELVLVFYALIFAVVSVYLQYVVFETVMTEDKFSHLGCHELFLTFDYSILNNPESYRSKIPFNKDGITILQIAQDIVLITILFICNSAVMFGLRDMQRRVHVGRTLSCNKEKQQPDMILSTGKEFSRLMLIVIIVFIILITPSMTRKLCNQLGVFPSYLADFISHHVATSSTFTNPFLYGLLRRKIRLRIAVRLTSCCRGCLPDVLIPTLPSSHFSDSRQVTFGRNVRQNSVSVSVIKKERIMKEIELKVIPEKVKCQNDVKSENQLTSKSYC